MGVAKQEIEMPKNAKILSAGLDPNGELCAWCMVEDTEAAASKTIYCIGTGWPVDLITAEAEDKLIFLNSVTQGEFVWHFFTIKENIFELIES